MNILGEKVAVEVRANGIVDEPLLFLGLIARLPNKNLHVINSSIPPHIRTHAHNHTDARRHTRRGNLVLENHIIVPSAFDNKSVFVEQGVAAQHRALSGSEFLTHILENLI